ncbi:MAG TPA: hypothetical protein VEG68_11100 [Terriglobales bacterium]|nr:hypothetical protein [Terriglobales bacterium]
MGGIGIWVRGLAAAFISGGASGVTGGITASVIDPNAFNLSTQLSHTLTLIGVTFLVSGILGVCAYLARSPLDDQRGKTLSAAA